MQILNAERRDSMIENTKPVEAEQENRESGDGVQSILDFGSAMTKTSHGNVYCLTIIGQIEGHSTAAQGTKTTKYEHVLPLLAKLEAPLFPLFP